MKLLVEGLPWCGAPMQTQIQIQIQTYKKCIVACFFSCFAFVVVFSLFSMFSHVTVAACTFYLAPLNLLQIQSFKDTNTFFVSLLVSISFVFLHFHCFHCFPKSQSRCPSAREYKFAYLQNKAAVALVRKKQKLYKNYTNTIQI